MKYDFVIHVKMAPNIFDPQATTIEKNLKKMSYPVEDLKVGKVFEFSVQADSEKLAFDIAEDMAKKVLSNPVLEVFEVERVKK